jgi:hypothetical protein
MNLPHFSRFRSGTRVPGSSQVWHRVPASSQEGQHSPVETTRLRYFRSLCTRIRFVWVPCRGTTQEQETPASAWAGERRRTVGANRKLKKQTRSLLFGLGSCRRDVAASLVRFGVRATPKDSLGDAVAVYLRAVVGSDKLVRSIAVQRGHVKIRLARKARIVPRRPVVVPLTGAIREFISAFDEEFYPELVRGRRRQSLPAG